MSDLANRSIKYVNKDGKYYQYRESTITDQDFEKKVNYTYEDDFTDTKFSNIGTGTATIHREKKVRPGKVFYLRMQLQRVASLRLPDGAIYLMERRFLKQKKLFL